MPRKPNPFKTVKKRSRKGCHNCKRLKIKCDEKKPKCSNCVKYKQHLCDYSLKLIWGGRPYKNREEEQQIVLKEFRAVQLEKQIESTSFVVETPQIYYHESFDNFEELESFEMFQDTPSGESIDTLELSPKNFQLNEMSVVKMETLDTLDSFFNSIDFSKFSNDIEEIEDSSYRNNLIQLPLRDQKTATSATTSPTSSSPEYVEEGFTYIPRPFEPMPDMLKDIPLYRELFHHFINVTADMLVPAPLIYPQNPFKTLLPAMSLGAPHLLSLLLAFSAYHRARYLRLPPPHDILGKLLSRTFQGLTKALENENESKSDVTLTTSIMLASYDILVETTSTWKKHLHGARDIVVSRKLTKPLLVNGSVGPKPLGFFKPGLDESDITYFLIRWFAYFDVVGALSSSHSSAFLSTNENMAQLWAVHDWSLARVKDGPVTVDLLLGLDLDIMPILSKVSYLIRERNRSNGNNDSLTSEAFQLANLMLSFCENYESQRKQFVNNYLSTTQELPIQIQMYSQVCAMNTTFCYAALIQLYRRALLLPTKSPFVQSVVQQATRVLDNCIPIGSRVESCMSFPIFATACEVMDEKVRDSYRKRLKGMERFGVGQVYSAIRTLELSWARGVHWTEILKENGWEFVFA